MEVKAYKGRPIAFFMKFYLILHFPNTVVQQPTCHFRNIEVESNDNRYLDSSDTLGPGRRILKIMNFHTLTVKTLTKYSAIFFPNFNKYFVDFCNNSDLILFSNALTFVRSLGRC